MLLADDKIWDQNGFNELVHKKMGPSVDDVSGLVYAYDGNLKLGILPASIFCSGHTYFVQVIRRPLFSSASFFTECSGLIDLLSELTITVQWQAMYQQFRLEPYAVHTTFQYAGTEGKRHRLREAMVFYDPPEYFDAPGKFCMRCMDRSFLLHDAHHFPNLLLQGIEKFKLF